MKKRLQLDSQIRDIEFPLNDEEIQRWYSLSVLDREIWIAERHERLQTAKLNEQIIREQQLKVSAASSVNTQSAILGKRQQSDRSTANTKSSRKHPDDISPVLSDFLSQSELASEQEEGEYDEKFQEEKANVIAQNFLAEMKPASELNVKSLAEKIMEALTKIIFTRTRIMSIVSRLNFKDIVKNCFVRISLPSTRGARYALCQIIDVVEAKKDRPVPSSGIGHSAAESILSRQLHLKWADRETIQEINYISNSAVTSSEVIAWLTQLSTVGQPLPTVEDLNSIAQKMKDNWKKMPQNDDNIDEISQTLAQRLEERHVKALPLSRITAYIGYLEDRLLNFEQALTANAENFQKTAEIQARMDTAQKQLSILNTLKLEAKANNDKQTIGDISNLQQNRTLQQPKQIAKTSHSTEMDDEKSYYQPIPMNASEAEQMRMKWSRFHDFSLPEIENTIDSWPLNDGVITLDDN